MLKPLRLPILFIVLLSFSFLRPTDAQFQATNVEKSNQKIVFQGVIYYIHKIKPGHTLYSIGKAYGVTEQDIRKANNGDNLDTLSVGQVIRIPVVSESQSQDTITQNTITQNTSFIYHTVQAKETTYSLHKKYNVPLELIYRYNPGTDQGLQVGQVVKIPVKTSITQVNKQQQEKQDDFIHYQVRPGDTLYSIAKYYNIPVADIIYVNDFLRWGLKAGQTLKIPTRPGLFAESLGIKPDSVMTISAIAQLSKYQCDSIALLNKMKPILKVALLLPFHASYDFEQDTSVLGDSIVEIENTDRSVKLKGRGAAEFYEGFLLAVDSLRKKGISIRLLVYDTRSDTNEIKQILKDLDIVNPDLIIGPLSTSNSKIVSEYSSYNKIPFIPPLIRSDSSVKRNPYLFQVMPTKQYEIKAFSEYLSQFSDRNIILIYKKSFIHSSEANQIKNSIYSNFTGSNQYDTLLINEVFLNDSMEENISKFLLEDKRNFVIILPTYEPEVRQVLTYLHSQLRFLDIEIFGRPAWQKYKNVQIDHYHDLQLTLYSPYFIDYSRPDVKRFISVCRKKLGYEPYKTSSKGTGLNYTFMGYDIGMYFIPFINTYRSNTCDCITNYPKKLLLTSYQFERNQGLSCFENNSINFIRYNKDFSIEKIEMPNVRNW
ncbi:MAG: LysM peptidoglycan-binding domain-containing protein [Bacteroidales bacterium]|nr:LysM peptidoglycan-binding domain-containing protein [Bacteroidales bacterium]